MFTVEKIKGGYLVLDWRGEPVTGYKNRKHAEDYARGAIICLHNEAENENARRDGIAAYLAERAARPAAAPSAQLELF